MTPLMRLVSILLRRPRRSRAQTAVILLGAVLVIAYGASTLLSIRRSYQQTLHDGNATLESVARSAEIGTSRSLFEIDAVLRGVDRMLTTVYSGTQWDDPEVHTLLGQFDEQTSAISEILILDDQGREINSSRAADGRPRNYANGTFFAEHRSEPPTGLSVRLPEQSTREGGWSIMMSRPLVRESVVRGVIAAEVPIAVFTGYFQCAFRCFATMVS
jgi:hypothetical protein